MMMDNYFVELARLDECIAASERNLAGSLKEGVSQTLIYRIKMEIMSYKYKRILLVESRLPAR